MNRNLPFLLMLVAVTLSTNVAAQQLLSWDSLPPIPDKLGFAGPFVGVHNDVMIVAGGANFPKPVWETDKVWHDRVFVLTKRDDNYTWKVGGKLPRPIAYGASVSTPGGVVCIGGNDAEQTFHEVFLLSWNAESKQLTTTTYPSLPRPCAYSAATMIGDVIYVAGGQSGQSLETAMTNFWSLDLSLKSDASKFVWKELPAWPGPTRALNLTVSQHNGEHDCVYVISGRRQDGPAEQESSFEFLRDVWEYNPSTNDWRRRRDAPRCVMAGTSIKYGRSHIFVLSGATEERFFKTNDHDHPGFIKQSLAYHTINDTWITAGASPANHVTTIAVQWGDDIIVPTGEVRPRVRTPNVLRVSVQPTE
jgi:solute:Na+ symporter, SSS family